MGTNQASHIQGTLGVLRSRRAICTVPFRTLSAVLPRFVAVVGEVEEDVHYHLVRVRV